MSAQVQEIPDISTTHDLDARRVQFGPHMARVAGLESTRLAIGCPLAAATAAEIHEIEELVLAAGQETGELLFRLVPSLDQDKGLRREVLALRRETKRESPRIDESVINRIAVAGADHNTLRALHAWNSLANKAKSLRERFSDEVHSEVQQANEVLQRLRADEGFLTAVADSSPSFAANPGDGTLSPGRRDTRTVLSYASRAARKTSPFGRLTTVSLAGAGASKQQAEAAVVSQSYVHAWLWVLARDEETSALFQFELLDTGGFDPVAEAVSIPELITHGDIVWKTSSRASLRGFAEVWNALQAHGNRWDLPPLLAAIGGSDPFATFMRFLEAGILYPVAPWDYKEPNAWRVLADLVEDNAPQSRAAGEIAELSERISLYLASSGSRRGTLKTDLAAHAEQFLARRGVPEDRRRFQIYLDVAETAVDTTLPGATSKSLESFGAELAARIQQRASYPLLVARFVETYGVSGKCSEAWRWLVEAAHDQGFYAQLQALHHRAGDVAARLGPSMPLPNTAVAFQTSEDPYAALIINQSHAGTGSVMARFAHVLDGSDGQLKQWASVLAHGGSAVEFVPSFEVNGLQSVSKGSLRRLVRPDDFPMKSALDEVTMTSMVIRHDVETDSLVFYAPDGETIVPLYMGIVPSHLLSGVDRLLATIADPWLLPRPGDAPFSRLEDQQRVVARPRKDLDGVVLSRAHWSVPLGELPTLSGTDEELVRNWTVWRRNQGIPSEVFVRFVRSTQSFSPADRKPIWVDLTSAHALSALCTALPKDALGVRLTEALPTGASLESQGDRAVEHLLFMTFAK